MKEIKLTPLEEELISDFGTEDWGFISDESYDYDKGVRTRSNSQACRLHIENKYIRQPSLANMQTAITLLLERIIQLEEKSL